jgi:hypothetical protein
MMDNKWAPFGISDTTKNRALSLDGSQIAVNVGGWINLNAVEWAADGKSLFVCYIGPEAAALLHVGSAGHAEPRESKKRNSHPRHRFR